MDTASDMRELDDLAVTTIRTLAMDAVQAAASGHPGTPIMRKQFGGHAELPAEGSK